MSLLMTLVPDVYKEDLSNSFEKLFNCTAKNLDYFGLNFQSKKFHSTAYGVKRAITIGLLVFCVFSVLKEILYRKWVDEHYFNVSLVGGTVLMVGPRILLMFLYRNELNELVEDVVNTTKPDYFSHLPDLESKLHLKYLNISRLMTRLLNISYHFCALIIVFVPMVNKKWFLLFYTVPPFLGHESHPGYEISLILEVYYVFFAVGFMEAFDNYFFYLTFYATMKSDVYIEMISKIGDYSSEYDSDEKQSLLIHQLCLIQRDLHRFLTKCTKIFGVYVFGQGAFSLFGMTMAFLMMKSSLLNFSVLFLIISTQLFLLCLFGEIVLLKVSTISNGIYCSQWYNIASIEDRKMLLHLLHSSQERISFSAMGIFEFSLAIFAAIIQKAYSFYAVLRNV